MNTKANTPAANQALTRPAATLSHRTGEDQALTRPTATLSHLMGEGHDEMVTKKELAARLKVTVRTIEHWQHDGCLPFIKVAGVLRFYWPDVVEHLKTNFEVSPRGVVRPRA